MEMHTLFFSRSGFWLRASLGGVIDSDGIHAGVGVKDPTSTLLQLLDTYGGQLHALLRRLTLRDETAEDLMQELFMKLMQSPGFLQADNKPAYARRSAMNLAFNWRRTCRCRPTEVPMQVEPPAQEPSALSGMIQQEQLEQILDAADTLSQACRDAFVMRHIQQESYEAIATQLDRTPAQARALTHKAVTQIRELLASKTNPSHPKEESHVQE